MAQQLHFQENKYTTVWLLARGDIPMCSLHSCHTMSTASCLAQTLGVGGGHRSFFSGQRTKIRSVTGMTFDGWPQPYSLSLRCKVESASTVEGRFPANGLFHQLVLHSCPRSYTGSLWLFAVHADDRWQCLHSVSRKVEVAHLTFVAVSCISGICKPRSNWETWFW